MKIVLDTNILVSGLMSRQGASFQIISMIGLGHFDIQLSVPLLFEYEDVLARKSLNLGISPQQVTQFLNYLCKVGDKHNIYFL